MSSGQTQTVALNNVDLTIQKGEFLMIMGPSGCGKTTLLSVIAGILKPNSGDCIVDNQSYMTMTQDDLLEFRSQNIGFIFQSFNLIPTLSVLDNIAVPLLILNETRREAREKAQHILDLVGLTDRAEERPQALSGGQQQRVAIARALIHKPKFLICDEPTSALDHTIGQKIMTLMKDINKKINTTFLIVTHDQRISHYADRIAYMDDGKIVRMES
ncbi:MAG: putative ABC transporter ATP-binding protein [Holosporales bacterium]